MRRRIKLGALAGAAAFAVALPVLGQDAPQSLLPPGFGAPPPKAEKPTGPAQTGAGQAVPAASGAAPVALPNADEAVAETSPNLLPSDIAKLAAAEATPPVEMPDEAKRSLALVGTDPVYGVDAFGDADGRYLATLMRRMQAPVASRWAEIMLRRALVGATPAPRGESQADWVADRAALLLRLGEADAARILVQGVDVERFSPRLRRVAIEAALATSDPQGLCPLPDGD